MRIFGLDFSAAPYESQPIACTSCVLESEVLYVHCLALLENLDSFENFLSSAGPWVAGIDFPFGQPRKLVLVARRLIDRRPYKGTSTDESSDLRLDARRDLLNGLMSQQLEDEFGVTLSVDPSIRDELIEEPSGSYLDAILCSLQATWAWNNREHGWGIPSSADTLEGWIVDPALAQQQHIEPALTSFR